MAESVSISDINEILGLERDESETSLSATSPPPSDTPNDQISPTSTKSTKTSNKKKKKKVDKKRQQSKLWKKLESQIQDGNINAVKRLIQLKKVKINDNTQWNGRTMLMMASEYGQYNICRLLINLGADVRMTTKYKDDARDASYFANKKGHYHISRLLLISSFGGESSAKISEMIKKLKLQSAMNENFIKMAQSNKDSQEWINKMIEYLCDLIERKMVFSDDMLSLCWNYIVFMKKDKAMESKLWKTIISSCDDVIQTKDSNNWYWLKQCMLSSTIWIQTNPQKNASSNDGQQSLKDLLIQTLFDLTTKQSIKNSEILKKIPAKLEENEWKKLVNFGIETKYGLMPRQDEIANGLMPKYSKEELSQNINSSTSFNALKHYDIRQYLPDLVLICHIINDQFQSSVMQCFGINAATNTNVSSSYTESKEDENKIFVKYRRGPIKQISRCMVKAENDYQTFKFPTSAHLLDVIRCTLIFNDVNGLLQSLKMFELKITNGNGGVIREIVRVKNGFSEWNEENPNYADIKLNVLIQCEDQYAVIGEIQFLLHDMSIYKLSAHKLYSIIRLDEEFGNLLKVKEIMMNHEKVLLNASYFNDAKEISNLMVIHQKNIKYISDKIDLKIICQTNGIKLLKVLRQYMNVSDLINRLKACNGFEIVCNLGYIDMMQYIYLAILPLDGIKGNEFDDLLRNGLREVLNAGHFEVLSWMLSENGRNEGFKFLKLWNSFDANDKHYFFRTLCGLGKTDAARLVVANFGDYFDVNEQSSDGYSALFKAVSGKRIETVKWMITLPNIDLITENKRKGRIVLFEAIVVGCFEIGELLLTQYEKLGNDPKEMLLYKSKEWGPSLKTCVQGAGERGTKSKEAAECVVRWAKKYGAVELQVVDYFRKEAGTKYISYPLL